MADVSVNVAVERDALSIGSLNVALAFPFRAMPVAAFAGVEEMTVGVVVGPPPSPVPPPSGAAAFPPSLPQAAARTRSFAEQDGLRLPDARGRAAWFVHKAGQR